MRRAALAATRAATRAAMVALLAAWLGLAACTAGLPPPAQIDSAPPEALAQLESGLRARITVTERDPEVLHRLARVLHRQQQLEEAEMLALEATQRAPFRADMLRGLGEIQFARGDRFRAALAFSQAVRVDPQDLEGYVLLGRARHALGETDPARQALQRAILIEPDYFEARLELARVLLETRSIPAAQAGAQGAAEDAAVLVDPLVLAAEQIVAARRIRPTSLEAALLHVQILKAQGALADARFIAEEAWQADLAGPAQTALLRELLDIHRQRQEWPEVKGALERLQAQGEPTSGDLLVRAEYLDATGDAEGAAVLRADLLRRFPRDASVLVAAARGMLAQNRAREALGALETAVQAAPQDAEARYWKSVTHYALGQTLEGDLALNRAEALYPEHPGVRLLRVRRLIAERRLGEAAPRMKGYRADFPADREGLLLQAELDTALGDFTEAENQLAVLPPEAPGVRFARARLDYLRGSYLGALEALAPLTALPEPPWEAAYLEAAALGRLGRTAEALDRLRPFLERDAGAPAFHRLAGALAHQAGDPRAAERFYQQGLRRFPRDGGLLEGISRIAVEREDWRQARGWLEAGVERDGPFFPLMLERLALVYRKLGEADRAKATLLRYLETIDPLLREGREPADPAILYRMTLPTLGLVLKAR